MQLGSGLPKTKKQKKNKKETKQNKQSDVHDQIQSEVNET